MTAQNVGQRVVRSPHLQVAISSHPSLSSQKILHTDDTKPLSAVHSPERKVAFTLPFPQLLPLSLIIERYTAVTSFGQKNGRKCRIMHLGKRVGGRSTSDRDGDGEELRDLVLVAYVAQEGATQHLRRTSIFC